VERTGSDLWRRQTRAWRSSAWAPGIARGPTDGNVRSRATTRASFSIRTLIEFGFASGVYDRRPDDGLTLVDCAIINALRCVPPQNKPTPEEIATFRQLSDAPRSAALPRLKVMVRARPDRA